MEDTALELGRVLGHREAFAAVAGHCSAAHVESLRRVRDGKLYKELGVTWDEFCEKRLGVSRRRIDRTLHLYDQFGPTYFQMAQIAHVTAEEYRAIAPHMGEDGIRLDGTVIALLPENSTRVSEAVAELVRRDPPVKAAPAGRSSADGVAKRCKALAEAFETLDTPVGYDEKKTVVKALCEVLKAAAGKGVMISQA